MALFVSVATAVIAALSALFVAIYSARRSGENQIEIETLKSKLDDERSARSARREYEYHARQRLYEQYEPLRFQLLEAVSTAKCQIETMSEQALGERLQHLGSTPTGNYWLLGTVYHLLHPAAVLRISLRRLTLVDLRIETAIHREYVLAKAAYLLLSHDARMAELAKLAYTPYVDGWQQKRLLDPSQFRRQGLPVGRLDNAIDTLIVRADDGERIATFGEFEQKFDQTSLEDVSGSFGAVRDLFIDFSPVVRPVLWRMLLAQFVIYKALLTSIGRNSESLEILIEPWDALTEAELSSLGAAKSGNERDPAFVDAARYLEIYVVPFVQDLSGTGPA
jgi:hypothetical protein